MCRGGSFARPILTLTCLMIMRGFRTRIANENLYKMRIPMNMRTLFSFLITLFLVSTLNITTSFAQDPPPQLIHRFSHGSHNVAFSPDGTLLAIGRFGGVDIRNVETGNEIRHIRYNRRSSVSSIVFSPDGTLLVIGGSAINDDVLVWDIAADEPRNRLEQVGEVSSVAFSPDGTTLAVGGGPWSPDTFPYDEEDWGILLYDVATGDLSKTLIGHTDVVFSVTFAPSGFSLASASGYEDGTARIWDVSTGEVRHTFKYNSSDDPALGDKYDVNSVAFSPNGHTLATGATKIRPGVGQDGDVRLWSLLRAGFIIETIEQPYNVNSVAFSPNGHTLATGNGRKLSGQHAEGNVRLWSTGQVFLRHTLEQTGRVYSVVFSPDSSLLASGGSEEVLVWGLPAPVTLTPNEIADQTFVVNMPIKPVVLPNATGGKPPYFYTLSPIPDGLGFLPTGPEIQLIGGTPTTVGITEVTYTATDARGASASLTFTITVTDAPTDGITVPSAIDDLELPVNTPMEPLSLPLAEGGTEPYTYTLEPIPAGLIFDATTQILSGTPTTAGTTLVTYTATDATGASASLTFTIEVIGDGPGAEPLDVDGDGQITVVDLAITALFYGTQVPVGVSLPADVNTDGVVDLADLTAVAGGIDAAGGGLNQLALWEVEAALLIAAEQAVELEAAAGAPGRAVASVSVRLSAKNVSDALATARTDVRKPQRGFAALEKFLALLTEMTATPETTALLANYPNPFNPETWIPYHLSKDAEVIVRIYDMRGVSVRQLVLGHQAAGVYQGRGRAAYWDGRNHHGEPVASGVYFYTLTAGEFTATRKLLIAK